MSDRTRTRVAAACAAALSLFGVAACGSSSSEPSSAASSADTSQGSTSEAPEDKPEATTITYMAAQNWVLDSEKELAGKFEAETGIHVDFQIVPADQYFSVLQTKLEAGGGGIDIFGGQSGKTDIKVQLNVEKNAVDLTDQEWVERMDPLSTDQVTLDGKVYGLTIWDTVGGSWVVVYNKKVFADNGISVPKSYAELAAACDTLVKADITPIYEPVSDGWHHVLWFAEMGPNYAAKAPGLVDKLNANQAKMVDDTTMTQSLTQLNELYSKGCFGQNALSDDFASTEEKMASGAYAMTVNRLGLPEQIESKFPDAKADNFGFFLMPIGDNRIWNVNPAAPTKFIYSGSKHVDAAKQYFEYLAKPENLQYMLDNEEQFALLDFEGVKAALTADQQAFVDGHPQQGIVLQTAVNYVNPQWTDMGKDIVAMFTGAATPSQVLETIDGRRAEQAKAAKDPAWN